MHFFNTPPNLTEEQLVNIFNSKDVLPIAIRMFPLKTERSSSGLIEFPSIAESVVAIMKCNHIPVENKGSSQKKIYDTRGGLLHSSLLATYYFKSELYHGYKSYQAKSWKTQIIQRYYNF